MEPPPGMSPPPTTEVMVMVCGRGVPVVGWGVVVMVSLGVVREAVLRMSQGRDCWRRVSKG